MSAPLEMYREQCGEYAYWYKGVEGGTTNLKVYEMNSVQQSLSKLTAIVLKGTLRYLK